MKQSNKNNISDMVNINETKCILCHKNNFSLVQKAEDPYTVNKCNHCGLVAVHPFPEDHNLLETYSQEYYKEWVSTQKKKRDKLWKRRFDFISGLKNKKGKILDIGCGDGSFLLNAKENGWDVCGTEFSPYAAKYVSKKIQSIVFNKDVTIIGFKKNNFDIITMWHVLEHVKNPFNVLLEIKKILKKDGILVIAVPNYNNWIMRITYRIFKGKPLPLFSITAKEQHLYHYTANTLAEILKQCGFKTIKLEPDISAIEWHKKIVDGIALIGYFLCRVKIFGALRLTAVIDEKN